MHDRRRWYHAAAAVVGVVVLAACGVGGDVAAPGEAAAISSPAPTTPITTRPITTTSAPATTTSTAPTSTTTTSTTTTSTSTSTTSTTTTSTTTTTTTVPAPPLPATIAAFDTLANTNAAVSLTVMRDGVPILARASGTTLEGLPTTSDSPMIVASVTKMVTAFAISQLQQDGTVDVTGPVPWDTIGITPHPDWANVTIRELLDHTSGMPVVRNSWFTGVGSCATFLPSLVAAPPQAHRGEWRYSNGNYCALGRLLEQLTGAPLDQAVQQLVFDALAVDGVHLTTDGLLPGDVGHGGAIDRLSRLGGAGAMIVSTDDLAAMLAAATPEDLTALAPPGLMIDQYGWGHTGTITGAKACVWVLEGGRTVFAATIAGNSPGTGGGVCDRIVPAVASDLGLGDGARPNRTP